MKLSQNVSQRGQRRGQTCYHATAETQAEIGILINNGMRASKFDKTGMVYYTYSGAVMDLVKQSINGTSGSWTEEETKHEEEETEEETTKSYASMKVSELRPLVRAKGWTGAEMLNMSKEILVKYLETGEKPELKVKFSLEDIGKSFVDIITQAGVGAGSVDEEAVKEIVREEMKNAIHRIEIMTHDGQAIPVGIQHYMFETLFKIASCSTTKRLDDGTLEKTGRPLDTMIVGPAGSGKTHLCKAVADALGIGFVAQSVGNQTTESKLVGYMDANGKYIPSPLYHSYKEGWLYLLDECDAGNANVLTVLNALLANGAYMFPNGEVITRHKNFICFAACNTFGRGADRQYVGRNQLDAASLDRFVVVDVDYDESLERIISGGTPKGGHKAKIGGATCTVDEWIDRVQGYRKAVNDLKERVVISPRASQKGVMLLAAGFGIAEVEKMTVWKGIDTALVEKIKGKARF